MDWSQLAAISEAIAYAFSILGITGFAWWLFYGLLNLVKDKLDK